ncbi:DUF2635 domain-containing protein [Mesorhizobium sp. 1M-11]|uniref:DUF2635 domain-containing protein n=1 Tax=Mesorhizobium sp. 1M-11 TaxID=1529006 RepID=UPI0006C7733B|nr:DUF2635 domain-containing protein [Mesorhizobium sp. 1M-11]
MPEKTLKLAEGRSVPMEDGKAWPAEGATVEVTLYIRRRLTDGDLVECKPAADQAVAEVPAEPTQSEPDSEPETVQTHTGRKGRNGGK